MMGDVGQPGRADDIADGVNVGHAGDVTVLGVGLDVVLDDLELELVGDEPFDIALHADGDQTRGGLDRLLAVLASRFRL